MVPPDRDDSRRLRLRAGDRPAVLARPPRPASLALLGRVTTATTRDFYVLSIFNSF